MYIVDFSKLKEGDILLTAQNGAISKAVRAVSKSSYSHAILYVGDGSYIHSDSEGVHAGNIQRLLFDKSKHVQALRPIEVKYAKEASIYARSQIGKEYSVKDAISTKNPLSKKSESNRQFCSRLVAKSYEYAGLNLVKNSSFCTPQDICESPEVIVVVEFLKEAIEEDIRFSKSENPLQRQSEVTNKILKNSRKLTKHDIQGFEDLGQFILDNPKYDIEITSVFPYSTRP